jgi:PleD family two-component response regulator
MTMKKTIRVPVLSDGVPLVEQARPADRTREIAGDESLSEDSVNDQTDAPQAVVNDEVTVPVHSSIESSLTFELLRRQSTDDEGSKK